MSLIQPRRSLNKYSLQFRWKSPTIFDRIDNPKIPIFLKIRGKLPISDYFIITGFIRGVKPKMISQAERKSNCPYFGKFWYPQGIYTLSTKLLKQIFVKLILGMGRVHKGTGTGVGSDQMLIIISQHIFMLVDILMESIFSFPGMIFQNLNS